ncbi:fungal pheromone STE3G-protein-coupled receptor [Rickenella mellea]|uniref:Fungal pheromone STE3G-protein-coupled receptor n=1 Tax=Rickenella mellea TaxID=50990 RepID=A0A4Y7PZD9_9AGAM|nr:fungal pheromone STE3G-protein-coupled receptor [Rickenella mellea]
MDPTYPLFSIVSFLCFLLVLSPLPWQFRVWNTGMCMYILWTASSCLIWFINSIIWKNNAADRAPIFCDISTRIIMGTGVAIPACSLCIQRRLYGITIAQAVTSDKYEKIRRVCVDLAICLGFPLFVMALAYIVQGRRYVIFEDVGCACYLYDVWPAFPIYTIWPLVLALISTVYCVMTFRSFARRRSQLKEFLDSGDSPIALNCYYRLMMLCCTEIIFTIPLASWILYLNFTKLTKYISWADTHSDFLIIETYPSIIWRNDKQLRISLEFGRWNIIICAIIFSAFFTFAEDSRNNYRAFSRKTAQRFGMKGTATRVNGTPGSAFLQSLCTFSEHFSPASAPGRIRT